MSEENGTIVTPTETPPVETPPVGTPPVGATPVETPPVETPPVETPPVETPPTPPVTNTLVGLGLSADILANERLAGVETVEDLAARLVEAKLAPEVPASDGYKLPEGAPVEIGDWANANNLTQEQLDGVMNQVVTWSNNSTETYKQQELNNLKAQGEAHLVEWGEAAEANTDLAVKAVEYMEAKNEGLAQMLEETGYGNHPVVLEVFKEIGLLIKEGGFVAGDTNTPPVKKSQAQRMFPTQGAK